MSASRSQSDRVARGAFPLGIFSAALLLFASCGGGGGGGSSGSGSGGSGTNAPPPPQALTIVTTTLDDAINGNVFFEAIEASGGMPPYTWTLVSGELPTGLAFEFMDFVRLSGMAVVSGQFQFSLRVTDSRSQTASRTLSLRVIEPLRITTPFKVHATLNQPMSLTIQAIGGTPR